VGAADSTFAVDSGTRDTATGGEEAGPGRDSGSSSAPEASTEDGPAGETSTEDASAEAAPGDSGTLEDGGSLADTGTPADSGVEPDTGAPLPDSGTPEAGLSDAGSTCPVHGVSGILVTFDLSGQPGNEASAAATSSVTGVTAGPISRSVGLTPVSGTDSINSSGWPAGTAPDKNLFDTFTITPAAGCTVTLTSLSIDVKASPTGPAHAEVGTSADGYTTVSTPFAGTSTETVTLSASGTAPITVRVFGYGATSSAGTLRIENTMTLSGTID
jgi:hypothetical protein